MNVCANICDTTSVHLTESKNASLLRQKQVDGCRNSNNREHDDTLTNGIRKIRPCFARHGSDSSMNMIPNLVHR